MFNLNRVKRSAGQRFASDDERHRIVIVGGGAAGLELTTTLSHNKRFSVTLIDKSRTHVWKPKLHEIAAGSMDTSRHEVGYLAHGRLHGFVFRIGELSGIDRTSRSIVIDPYVDHEGESVTPQRRIAYDTLVIAVGSQSNDFGTEGVQEHALKLETVKDAERFNRKLMNACFRAQSQEKSSTITQLRVCIIGAGATGVELAAELHRTRQEVLGSIDNFQGGQAAQLEIHLVEGADRILPALTPKLSDAAHQLLTKSGIQVHVGATVSRVDENTVTLKDGNVVPADITVWAAGVKAPAFLKTLDGLETNRLNQLVVRPSLQTTLDPNIFAIGDCAACLRPDGKTYVPPRAQAAHQQADYLAR